LASLYNYLNASRVETFLSDLEEANLGEKFHDRDRLLRCIHMLIWLHSSRPGSTAGAYAFGGLMDAIGLETWAFKRNPEAEKPTETDRTASTRPPGRVDVAEELRKLFPPDGAPRVVTQARDDGSGGDASDDERAVRSGIPSGTPGDASVDQETMDDFLEALRASRKPSEAVTRALHEAVDSDFVADMVSLAKSGRQPMVEGEPTSWSAWFAYWLAPALEQGLRGNAVTDPTEEMVQAAADAILSEWKAMAAEQGADLVPWPISPTNPRLLRAGIRRALEKAGRT